nr:uncharacterized protein LOC111423815 [Onthophagus taurus]
MIIGVFKMVLLIYFSTKITGLDILLNATYYCYIEDVDIGKINHFCYENSEGNNNQLVEGHNKTHVWFFLNNQQCITKKDHFIQNAECEYYPYQDRVVALPPSCGIDVYGKPIKCSDYFN